MAHPLTTRNGIIHCLALGRSAEELADDWSEAELRDAVQWVSGHVDPRQRRVLYEAVQLHRSRSRAAAREAVATIVIEQQPLIPGEPVDAPTIIEVWGPFPNEADALDFAERRAAECRAAGVGRVLHVTPMRMPHS
jgi:hypothetical protein